MHPEQACIALRAHEHREAFFPLDADFALRVTLQQPKLLCSSHLGETCPYSCRLRRRRYTAHPQMTCRKPQKQAALVSSYVGRARNSLHSSKLSLDGSSSY
jgi:hypothetical protein